MASSASAADILPGYKSQRALGFTPSGLAQTAAPPGLVAIEQALQRREMQLRLLPLTPDLFGHVGAHVVGLLAQRLAGALREHLDHARTLEIVEIVERVVHPIAADDEAVMGHEQNLRVAERVGDAIALVVAQRYAAVVLVIRSPAEEAHRIL